MSESLRDLLRQGADTVERPQLEMDELVARTERRLVRRRLAAVAASAAVVVLVAAGGFALRPDDERLAPAPTAPTETENPPGTPRELTFDEDESNVVVPPGLYAVPFSGWGDTPSKDDLRAVITFPAGFVSRYNSSFAGEGAGPARARVLDGAQGPLGLLRKLAPEDLYESRFHGGRPRDRPCHPAATTRHGSRSSHDRWVRRHVRRLTHPQANCPGIVLWLAPRVFHVAYEDQFVNPGDVARIWILDVDGTRVVIDTIHPADASVEKVAQLTRMVETATFMTLE